MLYKELIAFSFGFNSLLYLIYLDAHNACRSVLKTKESKYFERHKYILIFLIFLKFFFNVINTIGHCCYAVICYAVIALMHYVLIYLLLRSNQDNNKFIEVIYIRNILSNKTNHIPFK